MDSMRERFTAVTGQMLDRDPRLVLVLAVIGHRNFTEAGVTTRHPDRVIDVGIREQVMVGVASGLALEGFRPIVHTYAPFLIERPFEQLKLDFSHQDVGGIFVSVGASHDWAAGGRTHMAPGDIAVLSSLPGWRLHVPGHPDEVEAILRDEAQRDGRSYIRLSAQSNASPILSRGRVEVLRTGTPAAPLVLAVGPMLDSVAAAVADLDVHLAYTATVRPLDTESLRAAAGGTDVVVVEPYLAGTSIPSLAEALDDRPRRFLGLGIGSDELRRYGNAVDHDRAWGLEPQALRARIGAFVHRPAPGALLL